MTKYCLVLVILAVWNLVQGVPLSPYDEIVSAATSKNWDKLHKLYYGYWGEDGKTGLAENFARDGWKEVPIGGVRSLKPPSGGHVYGESEYTFHSTSNVDGRTTEQSGGHKVINDDGKVREFDFQPSDQTDLFKQFDLKPDFNKS